VLDTLDRDEPGAPPGFLLDPDDSRTHSHIEHHDRLRDRVRDRLRGEDEED
jgi:hypothetical protein